MTELQLKIAEFLTYSNRECKDVISKMRTQKIMLAELKALAKENNTILGRELRFPCADSYAPYIIIEVKPRVVRLAWFNYCDGWEDARLGKQGSVSSVFAHKEIEWQDRQDRPIKHDISQQFPRIFDAR